MFTLMIIYYLSGSATMHTVKLEGFTDRHACHVAQYDTVSDIERANLPGAMLMISSRCVAMQGKKHD